MASEVARYGEPRYWFSFELFADAASRYLLNDFVLSLTTVRGAIEQLLTKASKEAAAGVEDGVSDVDSGSGESDEEHTEGNASTFSRPRGVMDRDWRVYEVLDEMLKELHEKFKAIWA